MGRTSGSGANPMWKQQPDAVLSQANPVSGTKYTVLDTTKNVRIISIACDVTWATTQPTPLEIHVTIDGVAYNYYKADPVTATDYYAYPHPEKAENVQQPMSSTKADISRRAFLMDGKSVKVEIEITWATTQPTPLVCRVKYAKKV